MVRSLRAVVFAGGASERMGTDKALLRHPNGDSWLVTTVNLLRSVDLEVWVLSGHGSHRKCLAGQPGVTVQAEPWAPAGPLQAFGCVLSEREDEAWLTLPVDMPGLRRSTLLSLLQHWRRAEGLALVAEGGDRLQPLFGVYPCGANNRTALDQELAEGRGRWFGWLERIDYATFLCPDQDLINANGPDDLAALMR